ncbi:MAG TPA: hypothetical protein ENI87_01670 [bacterium]|nr:hypothetical protein [bacterium]
MAATLRRRRRCSVRCSPKTSSADHYLRAVYVLAGEHEVVFTYDGPRVVWPLRSTLPAWIVVLGCLLPLRRPSPPPHAGTSTSVRQQNGRSQW